METTIITLVGSLGFPIVACIWLATGFKKSQDALRDAINSNTKVLEKLCQISNPKASGGVSSV